MAENKTQPTSASVADFVAAVADPVRRADAAILIDLLGDASGEPAVMWGPSIIGFGSCRYTYDSGHTGTMPRVGFSPRKAETVLYLSPSAPGYDELLARLGRHRAGKACLYVKRLSDIDLDVLRRMVAVSVAEVDARYPRE